LRVSNDIIDKGNSNNTEIVNLNHNRLNLNHNNLDIKGKIFVFPNPFLTKSTIQVYPIETGESTLELFDIQGRKVKHLFNGVVEKEIVKSFILNREKLASGIYIIRFSTKNFTINNKIELR
jgi:hypothetical protein